MIESFLNSSACKGLTILVVEDETMVSFLIEDMLNMLGAARVLHAASVGEAQSVLNATRPDVAILDVNLAGEKVYPLAERLDEARVPFIFATGYGREGMPDPWARRDVIQKPFQLGTLVDGLRSVLRSW